MRNSKIIKRILKAVILAGLIILIIVIADAAFEFNEGSTEDMLTAYSHMPDIDTVFVGNSVGNMLDAKQYSDLSDTHSCNMCTLGQSPKVSRRCAELAASHHEIKSVILLMSFDTIDAAESYLETDNVFERVVDSSSPWYKGIYYSFKKKCRMSFDHDNINTERSLNVFIPWLNETAHGFDNVRSNLTRRFTRLMNREPLGYDIAFDLNTVMYKRFPGDFSESDLLTLDDDLQKASELPIPAGMISSDNITELARLCSFCRDNGIKLYIIVTPHSTDYYDRYEAFRGYSGITDAFLYDFLSKRGALYYNTENDPKLHEILPDSYFADPSHMDDAHYDEATAYLYDVIKRLDRPNGKEE